MHVARVLTRWLEERRLVEHKARSAALVRVVASALSGAKLSLTHPGRGRSGDTFEKHHIKAVDRLLGNRSLHLERVGIYTAIARAVLHHVSRPVIVVDWSDFEPGRKLILLKAAVPIGRRAITIYERHSRYHVLSFIRATSALLVFTCVLGTLGCDSDERRTNLRFPNLARYERSQGLW